LEENIRTNRLEDITVYPVALYDQETEIPFFIGDNPGTLGGSVNKVRGGANELKINARRLSGYLNQFESVDIVKMDIEGAEIRVLNDLVESSAINKVKEYIIEYHHNLEGNNQPFSSFLLQFEQHGFSYNISAAFSELRSPQDILIHFYK
jgi:FkbM family methyltransferase